MRPEDKQAALLQLTRVEAQLSALRLRLMAVSDDVAQTQGARDVAAMVTHHTRTDGAGNRRDLALALALDRRWSRAADALSTGNINLAQARVIAHALDEVKKLPADKASAEVLARAEEHLVAEAAHFGPRSCGCSAAGCSTWSRRRLPSSTRRSSLRPRNGERGGGVPPW